MFRLFALVIAGPLAVLAHAAVLPSAARSNDWPQFRGPKRDDVSTETGLLPAWPKGGPKLLWKGTGVGRDGKKLIFNNSDMKFTYRNSAVDPSIIFTSARFRGTIAAPEAIRKRMEEVQSHRETAQPIREKTGGSTFKNPPGHSAWKLIDAAGCRGLRVGGAQVSEMHCNFLINTGNATGHDIETLGETVRARVKEICGIELHWEIKRIGIPA